MLSIGSLKLEGNVFLAPMADFTHVAFRLLCKEYGAALVYTELISCKGILQQNRRTRKMLAVSLQEKPAFLQLFGDTPAEFAQAVKLAEQDCNFDGYDVNCGCSVPKALKGKYGISLMQEPKLIGNVISEMVSATEKPVTLKMRLGLKEETFLQVAGEAQDNGASALALHARFGEQGYSGEADWEKIAELKKSVKIPVIGNGDVRVAEDAMRMVEQTGCDAVMAGRACIGNAFFFRQANALLEGKMVPERSVKEWMREGKRFIELCDAFSLDVNMRRGYFISFVKGFENAPEWRKRFALSKSNEEITETLEILERHLLAERIQLVSR